MVDEDSHISKGDDIVSVIIPVNNGEKTIGKCLDSVINQSMGDFEVIVIDNASIDSTKDLVLSYSKRDERSALFQGS